MVELRFEGEPYELYEIIDRLTTGRLKEFGVKTQEQIDVEIADAARDLLTAELMKLKVQPVFFVLQREVMPIDAAAQSFQILAVCDSMGEAQSIVPDVPLPISKRPNQNVWRAIRSGVDTAVVAVSRNVMLAASLDAMVETDYNRGA